MKNTLLTIALLWIVSIGYTQDFRVDYYEVDIYINEEGYFDVVENYDLYFQIPKHGIYRTIQTNYDLLTSEGNQEKRKIKISNIEVPDYHFEAPFDFVQKMSDNLEIKIGDANITLMGPQHYEIKYRVHNAFLFEKNGIHFYWNIKPEGWWANFNKIDFTIHLPEGLSAHEDNFRVYSGNTGTTTAAKDIEVTYENGVVKGKSINYFVSYPGQSITVLLTLPSNSIKEIKPLWPFWTNYGYVFIIGLLVLGFYIIWNKYGKDDSVIGVTGYYPPENMDPAMAGFLINDRDDNSDLISLIPYWGSRGIIKIQEIPKKNWLTADDTLLTRLQMLPDSTPEYEKTMFTGLFGSFNSDTAKDVKVSSLKNTFYTTMTKSRTLLKENAQPYYEAASKSVKNLNLGILVLLAILLFPLVLFIWGLLGAFAVLLTCIVLAFVNVHMVKKNAKGNRVFSELKGFKRFIKVAEENKLKMLLSEDPTYFESTMSYALAFGLFDQWSKKFDALHIAPPSWYSSQGTLHMNMNSFSRSFSGAMSSAKSTMVSSPSSSSSGGGGSSGGGFGGGGGGSW